MIKSQEVRRHLLGSDMIRDEIAARLELNPKLVSTSLADLIDANAVPCDLRDTAAALAFDGAAVLMAIGGRQRHPPTAMRTVTRLSAMPLRNEIGDAAPDGGTADTYPNESDRFGQAIGELLLKLWTASRDPSTKAFSGVSVGIFWSAAPEDLLFGTIEHKATSRRRVYAGEPPPTDGAWPAPVGGIIFSPRSILRFGALLDAAVTDTPAALKDPGVPMRRSVATDTKST
ncbi:hypothetical protein AB4Z51_29125 [Bradyrhizobium sp. 2TAF36]|uniref:hypothetical protein n=1 Tax=Bradyrhizobium sp. 2TAF36 TaxID=3233016 RepID=UPI003F900D58